MVEAFHVGGPAVLGRDDAAGGGDEAVADNNFLLAYSSFLFLLILGQLEPLLGDGDEGLVVILLQLLHGVLIDGVAHVQHLVARLLDALDEGGVLNLLAALAGDAVDGLLLHAGDVVLQTGHVVSGRVVAHEVGDPLAVDEVLMDVVPSL